MKASAAIIAKIKKEEGFSPKAYRDDDGKTAKVEFSIGYGHQIGPNEQYLMKSVLTEKQASDLLLKDLVSYENSVNAPLKRAITQNQFDALLMFAYNTGSVPSAISGLINSGADSTAVANQMKKYVYWTGNPDKVAAKKPFPPLVKRRAYEAGLFLSSLESVTATIVATAEKKKV